MGGKKKRKARKAPQGKGRGRKAGARTRPTTEELEQAALAEATVAHAFGPGFFLSQLRAFACEDCPDPKEALPVVEIRLGDGETLDLCHIIGVTPSWVALAVREETRGNEAPRMRTEFVSYAAIARVSVRPARPEAPLIGFEHSRVPKVLSSTPRRRMSPEEALRAAAQERRGGQSG